MCVRQQLAEFGLIDGIERLVSGNDPLGQQILKLFLIPRPLENVNVSESALAKQG